MRTEPWNYGFEVHPNAEFRALLRDAAKTHDLHALARLAAEHGTNEVLEALKFDLLWPEDADAAFRLFGELLEYFTGLIEHVERQHQTILSLRHPNVVLSKSTNETDDIPF